MTESMIPKMPLIKLLDALRAFAVMAMLLVFLFPIYPDPSSQAEWLNILEWIKFLNS